MDNIGTLIDRLLKQQQMTQLELSKRSELAPGHISLIIQGKCIISVPSAKAIARGLGIISAREILIHQIDYQLEQLYSLTHEENT